LTDSGRGALIRSIGDKASVIDSFTVRNMIDRLNTPEDFERLRGQVGQPGFNATMPGVVTERFINALDDITTKFRELDDTMGERLRGAGTSADRTREQWERMGTFPGAQREDRISLINAQDRLTRSLARRDPIEDIKEGYLNTAIAAGAERVRSGTLSEREFAGQSLTLSTVFEKDTDQKKRTAILDMSQKNPSLVGGSDIQDALFGNARDAGMSGDAKGSFLGGFRSVMEGAKKDLLDFSTFGAQIASSLHQSGVDAWSSWVTGATRGKEAFRGFAVSILSDAQRMIASKTFTSLFSMIPGFGGFSMNANGGPIGMATGGFVPAMLTGGEYIFGPNVARKIGHDTLQKLNGRSSVCTNLK